MHVACLGGKPERAMLHAVMQFVCACVCVTELVSGPKCVAGAGAYAAMRQTVGALQLSRVP
jgi:hypothetical protein